MRTIRWVCVWMLVGSPLVLLVGCPGAAPSDMSMGADSPTGSELFRLITETDPYQAWAQFPGVEGIIASAPPHGPMARVFINTSVEAALENFSGRLPDGSVILKESFVDTTPETPDTLTIMWKVSGFDPENNDWFWANMTPAGVVNAEGRVTGCTSCHSDARDNDFVFLHEF